MPAQRLLLCWLGEHVLLVGVVHLPGSLRRRLLRFSWQMHDTLQHSRPLLRSWLGITSHQKQALRFGIAHQ